MSTQTCSSSLSLVPDVNSVAPAVIAWKVNDATHYLTDPDPRSGDLVFESRFLHSSGSFRLRIPIRLKGIDCDTHVILLIHPSSITSLEHESFPTVPDPVQTKLNCSTVRLRFRLHQPVDIVAPLAAKVPLQPKRRPSGEVLDALRSLAQATSLDIYLPDTELPKLKVQAICDAIAGNRLKSTEQDDLASLYSGEGGKILDFSACLRDSPPSYDEVEPPPPMAPLSTTNKKKRRRLHSGSSDEKDCRFDAIWGELMKIRKENTRYEERIQQLEGRVEQLEKEKLGIEQELHTLRSGFEEANDHAQVLEVDVLDVRRDLDDLEEQVDALAQNGLDSDVEERITDRVTDRVLDDILGQSYNATVTFERN